VKNPYHTDLPIVYLKPGELCFAENPTLVTTVLGSCVSVIMYNHRLCIGAICHALLPTGSCLDDEGFRYVECSVDRMLEKFHELKVDRREIEVKLFGGADILTLFKADGRAKTIGQQNIQAALAIIETKGLNLVSSDVGGSTGRKLFFYTHTGEVLLKRQRRLGYVTPDAPLKTGQKPL